MLFSNWEDWRLCVLFLEICFAMARMQWHRLESEGVDSQGTCHGRKGSQNIGRVQVRRTQLFPPLTKTALSNGYTASEAIACPPTTFFAAAAMGVIGEGKEDVVSVPGSLPTSLEEDGGAVGKIWDVLRRGFPWRILRIGLSCDGL
jgi:hypothetical protein